MVRGLFVIFGLLGIGSLISVAINGLVPGSVIGMLLMFLGLQLRIIKPAWIASTANALTGTMALFFVPAGVGIMVAFDILAKSWHEILFISLVSTVCVIATVGLTQQWMERRRR
ncbi:MAG TPA: CidA/LrgA family protein [Prolixibacteraceae bacterium]